MLIVAAFVPRFLVIQIVKGPSMRTSILTLLLNARLALTATAVAFALSILLPTVTLAQATYGNTDLPGGDYRNFEIPPRTNSIAGDGVADRCREACKNDQRCVSWTAVRPGVQSKNGVCWLKNSFPARRADSCCTSGTKVTPIGASGTKRPSGGGTTERQLSAEQQQLLDMHNAHRRTCGAPALSWSWAVADSAQTWANGCHTKKSNSSSFCHQNVAAKDVPECGTFPRTTYGENLHWGESVTPETADKGWWANEIRKYNFGTPVYSDEVGHFTQMAWRTTTQLGCAKSVCGKNTLWVCRYEKRGNVGVTPAGPAAQASLLANVSNTCK
jgi:uncharacterized protein YkwD